MKLTQKELLAKIGPDEQFTTTGLAKKLGYPKEKICSMVYTMNKSGRVRVVGKRNRGPDFNYGLENVYEKTSQEPEFKAPSGYITPFPLVPIK